MLCLVTLPKSYQLYLEYISVSNIALQLCVFFVFLCLCVTRFIDTFARNDAWLIYFVTVVCVLLGTYFGFLWYKCCMVDLQLLCQWFSKCILHTYNNGTMVQV